MTQTDTCTHAHTSCNFSPELYFTLPKHKFPIGSCYLDPCIPEQAYQHAAGSPSGAGSQITFPFTFL